MNDIIRNCIYKVIDFIEENDNDNNNDKDEEKRRIRKKGGKGSKNVS